MLECGREKFLVFAHHKLVLDSITKELGEKVCPNWSFFLPQTFPISCQKPRWNLQTLFRIYRIISQSIKTLVLKIKRKNETRSNMSRTVYQGHISYCDFIYLYIYIFWSRSRYLTVEVWCHRVKWLRWLS